MQLILFVLHSEKARFFLKNYITSSLHSGRVSGYRSFEGNRPTTQRRNPEYVNPQQHRCENLYSWNCNVEREKQIKLCTSNKN
jgi:hypothetical protein